MMVFLGTDAHKRSHTVVAIDAVGAEIGSVTVAATPEGHLRLVKWAARWEQRRWAIEDCSHTVTPPIFISYSAKNSRARPAGRSFPRKVAIALGSDRLPLMIRHSQTARPSPRAKRRSAPNRLDLGRPSTHTPSSTPRTECSTM